MLIHMGQANEPLAVELNIHGPQAKEILRGSKTSILQNASKAGKISCQRNSPVSDDSFQKALHTRECIPSFDSQTITQAVRVTYWEFYPANHRWDG